MDRRLELHKILLSLITDWNPKAKVYFQPPPTVYMSYPCIRYKFENNNERHADNRAYIKKKRYTLTFIDTNPDSRFPDLLDELEYCSLDRQYSSDNLYHWVFTIYY